MTLSNQIISNFIQSGPEILVKWMTVAGLVMYTIFAIVVIKQVSIMSESIESEVNAVVKLFSWLHMLMALLLIGISIVWL